jgi:hypothetical protein
MPENEEQIYIPKRKIKKNRYLELKKVNEEYESTIDIWGSSNGDDQKTRKIKARKIIQNNPDLTLFRTVLTTAPIVGEDEVCEGFRYWIMKENGTLPVKKKAEPLLIIEEVKPEISDELSLSEEVTLHYPATEEQLIGKKEKVTFGKKLAKFFGF